MADITVKRITRTVKVNVVNRNITVNRPIRNVVVNQVGRRGLPGADGPPGVVQSIVAGTNTTVDATDPANPVINSTSTAETTSFDDTVVSAASGGTITGDDVQDIINTIVTAFSSAVASIFQQLGVINYVDHSEMLPLEARTHYAVVGGGAWADYTATPFSLPSQGDFADGGYDIYIEVMALWGADNGVEYDNEFGEDFTIEDPTNDGGDFIEMATVMKGQRAHPFFEFNKLGNTSEDPRVIVEDWYALPWQLARIRYTHDGPNGISRVWVPTVQGGTVDGTAHGVNWTIVSETDQGQPWPLDTGVTSDWMIGRGAGRRLISRVIVNEFDGTPKADFNPSNATDSLTVPDPIAGQDWVSSGIPYVINTKDFVLKWLSDEESGAVDSVNGQTGTVILTQDNVADGTTYKQFSGTEKTKLANSPDNPSALYRGTTGDYLPIHAFTSTTTASMANQRVYYSPIYIGKSLSVDRVGLVITASTANVGSTIEIGLYSDSNGRPGSRIDTYGTVAANANAALEITISKTLSPGWYWTGTLATFSSGAVTVRSIGTTRWVVPDTGLMNSLGQPNLSLIQNGQATLPNPATAGGATGVAPVLSMRIA